MAGESACPTKTQALVHQSGTDAFVCQPGDLSDSFTASHGRGSGSDSLAGALWGVLTPPRALARLRSGQTLSSVTPAISAILSRLLTVAAPARTLARLLRGACSPSSTHWCA